MNNILQHLNFCFISDDLTHEVDFVYHVIKTVILHIKEIIPTLKKVIFFTDGSAKEYKNCKNIYNLCQLQDEFGVSGEWNFFATSHGKSPCDGLGGTVKHLTALESLKRPYRNQILSAKAVFDFCNANVKGIKFFFFYKRRN